MTQWTWKFKLIDNGNNVTSNLVARFDDERVEEIQARFTEFLRGCGYTVPRIFGDENTSAMLDDAMGLLRNHDLHSSPKWQSDYKELCKRYEEALG